MTKEGDIILSSIPDGTGVQWAEVEADGIYFIDLNSDSTTSDFEIQSTPYCFGSDTSATELRKVSPRGSVDYTGKLILLDRRYVH